MKPNTMIKAALATSALSVLAALPVHAQDQGGTTTVFGFSETLGYITNPDLAAGGTDRLMTLGTELSFGFSSRKAGESLSLDGGVGLLLRDEDGSFDTQIITPHVGLAYSREARDAAFSLNADYSRDRIELLRPLSDFTNADGVLVLPTSPSELVGTGLRQELSGGVQVELGKTAPLGLILSANASQIDYSDTSDPDLVDKQTTDISVTGLYRMSPVATLSLGVQQSTDSVTGDSRNLRLGLDYRVSPVFDIALGADHSLDDNSTSPTLSGVYRLQTGQLSFDVTRDSTEVVFTQRTATGQLTARAGQEQDDSGTGTVNLLGLGYAQAINDVSRLGVGLFYTDQNGTASDSTATEVVVNYSHSLTQDWDLNAGMNYRMRDSQNSTGLFVGVSRSFSVGR